MTAILPRIIHTVWLQGEDAAPPLVRLNQRRWTRLNPDHRLQVLDEAGVMELLGPHALALDGMTPQALSDVARVRLLLEQGGVWADASLFPVKPLHAWLPQATRASGFFAFERPGPDRLISSWFLAAAPGHPVVEAWWREVASFWSTPRRLVHGMSDDPLASVASQGEQAATYPYFWVHYLLERALRRDEEAQRRFELGEHRSAIVGRSLRDQLQAGLLDAETLRSAASVAPVQKLDWRHTYPLEVLASL